MGLYGGSTPPKDESLIPLGHWDTGDKRANTRYPNYSPKTRFQAKFNFSPRPPRTPLQSVVHHNVGMLIPFMTSKRPKKAYNSHFGGSPLQFSCICYYFSVIFNKKQDPNPKKQKKHFFLIFWTIFPIQEEPFKVIFAVIAGNLRVFTTIYGWNTAVNWRTPLPSVVHHNVGILIPFMASKRPKKAYDSHFRGSPLQFSCICYYFSVIFNKKQDPNPKKQKKHFFLIFWTIFPIQEEPFKVIFAVIAGNLRVFTTIYGWNTAVNWRCPNSRQDPTQKIKEHFLIIIFW